MIAYYAHSQGFGHSNSGQEFCRAIGNNALIISASAFNFDKSIKVTKISSEDTDYQNYLKTIYNIPVYAHYLPKSKKNILLRNFQILDCCIKYNIKFALVDVSVETALQFRIAGIPYAYHKMLGDRDDLPHRIAYEASEFLFAYYPKQMENSSDRNLNAKTTYLGFISRFKFRVAPKTDKLDPKGNLKILILMGNGGTRLNKDTITSICSQQKHYHFTLVGLNESINLPNLTQLTFTKDLEFLISRNDLVLSSCGINLTSEVLAIKNKFIAIPEDRPYDEQHMIMQGLEKNNLAVQLDLDNIHDSISQYLKLPLNKDLESYFGSMDEFKKLENLKSYL